MKKSFLSGIFILFMAAIVVLQIFYDSEKSKASYSEPIVFKSDIVRVVDVGLHNAASDLMWLASIQYLGGGETPTYEKLDDYLFLASDLDPKFAYPYAFGALLLPSFQQVDKGIEIGLKGIENNVPDYRIPYYTATTYHLNKDDPINAAKYFDIAANTQGAPEGIKRVAANFGSRSDKRSKTMAIWEGIYTTTRDEIVKERAKNYLIHLQIMDLFDEASSQYFKQNNKYPTTPQDLVDAKILRAIPLDPFGFDFTFSTEGKVQVKN